MGCTGDLHFRCVFVVRVRSGTWEGRTAERIESAVLEDVTPSAACSTVVDPRSRSRRTTIRGSFTREEYEIELSRSTNVGNYHPLFVPRMGWPTLHTARIPGGMPMSEGVGCWHARGEDSHPCPSPTIFPLWERKSAEWIFVLAGRAFLGFN